MVRENEAEKFIENVIKDYYVTIKGMKPDELEEIIF
jgi:hypothetical protein